MMYHGKLTTPTQKRILVLLNKRFWGKSNAVKQYVDKFKTERIQKDYWVYNFIGKRPMECS